MDLSKCLIAGLGLSANFPAPSCSFIYEICRLYNGIGGTFWLQPDERSAPFQAQCTGDGWALAAKIDGYYHTFDYDSPLWTDCQLLDEIPGSPATFKSGQAKYRSFVHLPGSRIRVVMSTEANAVGDPLELSVGSFLSLRSLFSGPALRTSAPLGDWASLVPGGASHQDCRLQSSLGGVGWRVNTCH